MRLQGQTEFITPTMPHADLAVKYLQCLLSMETGRAKSLILQAVEEGVPIRDVYLQVFQPVQYEVGRLWESGQISVGQEHYCTNATQLIMSMLYSRLFSGATDGRRLLAACVQGELHELGLRMLSDFFEMDGWNTDYIGANTPNESIVKALEMMNYDLLAVSVTLYDRLDDAKKLMDTVRSSKNIGDIPILVGGYAILHTGSAWKDMGADGTAPDAQQALGIADELIRRRRRNIL